MFLLARANCSRKREKGKAKGQLYSVYTNIKTGVTLYSRLQLYEKYEVVDPEPDLRTLRHGQPKGKAKAKAKSKARAKAKAKARGQPSAGDSLDSDENINDGSDEGASEGRGRLYLMCNGKN